VADKLEKAEGGLRIGLFDHLKRTVSARKSWRLFGIEWLAGGSGNAMGRMRGRAAGRLLLASAWSNERVFPPTKKKVASPPATS